MPVILHFFGMQTLQRCQNPISPSSISKKTLDHRSWHCSDYNDSKLMVQLSKKKEKKKAQLILWPPFFNC